MWDTTKLGNVLELEYGKGLPKRDRNDEGNYPVYGSNGIVGHHDDYLIDFPCLIVGRKGAAGEVHISKKKCWPIDTTYYVKAPENWNLRFLFYLLKSLKLQQHDRSTAIPGLNRNDAYDLEIPTPPLHTQNRIVEKIEELFSELNNGVENLKKAQQQLRTYRQAVLKDAFEGKLTRKWREQQDDLPTPEEFLEQIKAERKAHRQHELAEWEKEVEQWEKDGKPGKKSWKPRKSKSLPKITSKEIEKTVSDLPENWKWFRVNDLGKEIFDGPFGSNLKTKDYTESGVRVIRLENIGWLNFKNEEKTFISEEKYETIKKHTIKGGDIIFSSFIADETRVVVLPENIERAVNKADCFCIRPFSVVNPKYLTYYLGTRQAYGLLENEVHGATRPRINTTQLKSLLVPLCSKEEQVQIVNEIESRLSVVDQLEQTIKENLQKAEALRQSILKKAFGGELVEEESIKKPQELQVTPFEQMQMIGVLIEILKEEYDMAYGEMALAKFLFLVDRTKKYKTGFSFKDWHWGPYDPDIKKRLFSKSSFFKQNRKKHSVIELKDNQDQLFKYNLRERDVLESGVRDIADIIRQFKGRKKTSRQLELLATVAKAIENESSTDLEVVREGMKKWKTPKTEFRNKAEKFTEEETEKCLSFIKKQGWDLMLIDK